MQRLKIEIRISDPNRRFEVSPIVGISEQETEKRGYVKYFPFIKCNKKGKIEQKKSITFWKKIIKWK